MKNNVVCRKREHARKFRREWKATAFNM